MKIGGVDVSDFDIGIGWQTKGNYGGWRLWILSAYNNQYQGDITKNNIGMFMITVIGFYFRIHVFRHDMTSKQWMKTNE